MATNRIQVIRCSRQRNNNQQAIHPLPSQFQRLVHSIELTYAEKHDEFLVREYIV
jgi:hypothetical protein